MLQYVVFYYYVFLIIHLLLDEEHNIKCSSGNAVLSFTHSNAAWSPEYPLITTVESIPDIGMHLPISAGGIGIGFSLGFIILVVCQLSTVSYVNVIN